MTQVSVMEISYANLVDMLVTLPQLLVAIV